jgi:putative DNA methylase
MDAAHQNVLRFALLDFIADFANWDNSTVSAYLETSRALTQAAHEALGGEPGTRPLVVDPFAGGGSIPLEALRVGADAFASDLNPVAVLLNKVVLEYIPKYGQKLADEVRKWGRWIKEQAEKELAEFYPKDPDGATPIAYLWARTIRCEGAGCGAEVPLMRSLWLAKKGNKSVALKIVSNLEAKRVDFQIIGQSASGGCKPSEVGEGTVKRGSATCPCCGFTTPVKSVRQQLKKRRGGAADARLYCVVTTRANVQGRFYRHPTECDLEAVAKAAQELEKHKRAHSGPLSLVPDEPTPMGGGAGAGRAFSQRHYGMEQFGDLFTPRQLLALTTLAKLVRVAGAKLATEHDAGLAEAVQTALALCFNRVADLANSLCGWKLDVQCPTHLFARQAIPIVWDFCESVAISESSGAIIVMTDRLADVLQDLGSDWRIGTIACSSATSHALPNDAANAFITDPPYYDAVPYADLSDFFYVWFKRTLPSGSGSAFTEPLTPKADECIVDEAKGKDNEYFEKTMGTAMSEARRYMDDRGIGIVVFAHKSTSGWEAQLQAMTDAGWTTTGSWPIDTEMDTRLRARDSAALASSVHLVCRPRLGDDAGDWRDVLSELPLRMHEWMPRLASEGVVGADAIFACLGPALEIFSRYSRVEKANGAPVLLKEYLEHVWAAVSKEALSTIFRDADASGLEPDARLTAMWLWTIGGGSPRSISINEDHAESNIESPAPDRIIQRIGRMKREREIEENDALDDEDDGSRKALAASGFILEFDAARKIAQGLGIHLKRSESVVEVKGEKARLLAVAERTKHLFGKDSDAGPTGGQKAKKKVRQPSLFDELEETEEADGGWKELNGPPPGTTILDRLHQSMILFGAQRGELLKRFLVEDGVGKDTRFWKLAQSLAALYPPGTDERRWVEGVLARKKSLGL